MINILNEGMENTFNTYCWFITDSAFKSFSCSLVCVCISCGKLVLLCVPGPAMVRCVSDDGCGGDLWGLHRFSTVWPQERHPWNPSSPWSGGILWAVRGSGTAQHQPVRWEAPNTLYITTTLKTHCDMDLEKNGVTFIMTTRGSLRVA